ncbi:TIGR02678 family protein [Kineococcus arenarius]|uniref:TIGR02678 family protein n=1 Tax=Kineococcus sp. SYSU DK007 TaxID=3383128 RepID=UPI003D7D8681
MSGALLERLEAERLHEQRRAARALLRRPLLGPAADEFPLVRRHADALREWFDVNTGWRLIVGPELARLEKVPADPGDGTRPLLDAQKRPFSRRRYVLLCLALAVLSRSEAQVTLGVLADEVLLLAADPALVEAGVEFSLQTAEERRDLAAVARTLLGLGVVARVSGDEETFVRATGDVLYDVDRRVLASLLAAERGPSTVDATDTGARLEALTDAPPPLTEEARTRAVRHRLTRRLLDDPVLLHADLDAEETAYLSSQRAALCRRVEEFAGLVAEVRAEGIAMVDPADELTDLRMPEDGTDGHVALLVAELLTERAPAPVPLEELRRHVHRLARENTANWRKGSADPGAEVGLVQTAVDRLAALRLVRVVPGAVGALPPLHRYALCSSASSNPAPSEEP